jgi:hypothetical protein
VAGDAVTLGSTMHANPTGFRQHDGSGIMKILVPLIGLSLVIAGCAIPSGAQTTTSNTPSAAAQAAKPVETPAARPANPWDFDLSVNGYIVPNGQSYVSPTLTADRDTLHLEARYNYEGQRTGSLWLGHNFSVGKKLTLDATPMIGGVFGNINGIAPGLELTLTYKKFEFYSANEYIFDTNTKSGNFFYTWTQLTYTPVKWFTVGYVAQRTRAHETPLVIQRGPLIGFTLKKFTFTTQVFNIGETDPTTVLSLGYSF